MTSHQKAAYLWEEYKERIGHTDSPHIIYDLEQLLQQQDLSHLNQTFTKEEIDDAVKHLPNDKAPGPDGFNGRFIKKC